MDITSLGQLISTLGFPIVSAIFCYWYIATSNDKRIAETKELTKIISDNTLAIQKLCDRIEFLERTYADIYKHRDTDTND